MMNELVLGTFCPKCLRPYNGNEITLGRNPEYSSVLVPITRCAFCAHLHVWAPEIVKTIEENQRRNLTEVK